MNALDRWREIGGSLRRRRLRTGLTALSVAWGIFMLVLLLAAGNGFANATDNAFGDEAGNSVWLFGSLTTKPFGGRPKGRSIPMDNEDFKLVSQTARQADHISARTYYGPGQLNVSHRGRQGAFEMKAVHPDHQYIEKTILIRGRYLNEADLRDRRKVVVAGKRAVMVLFEEGADAIGQDIKIGKSVFTVIGILDDTGRQESGTLYVPSTTAQLVFSGSNRIHQVMMTVGNTPVAEVEHLVHDLRRRLANRHSYDPTDTGGIEIFNAHLIFEKLQALMSAIRSFVWLMGLGTIMAGIVGVGNIMLISVKERTKEFGIRKALGATPWSIVLMVMEESLLVTTAAGYMGLVAAVGVVESVKKLLPKNDFIRNPEVDIGVGLWATAILVVAGILAGLWPARRAARIHPSEAFRAEG